ncbi:MAG: toll/interleukin-1 receptor domain-containing protein, partial [Phycisphaerales bacterium]
MAKLFISHATADDAFVRKLREQVELFGLSGWVDSRELRGGDSLWPEIKAAIEKADAFVVGVSPDSLQSQWVGRELKHAMSVQESRGRDAYRVVPLSIDGTRLGVMQAIFDDTPVYIEASADLAGAEAVLGELLEASGTRLPTERFDLSRPDAPPLEDLVLELSDLKMEESEGVRRPTARARLVYRPAAPGMPDVNSKRSWRLRAPLGPIEADDLRWYLEKYAVWPSAHFKDRAKRVEDHLSVWGRLLHEAAMPLVHTEGVMRAWARVDDGANRRFSVRVDVVLDAGAPVADGAAAMLAATLL